MKITLTSLPFLLLMAIPLNAQTIISPSGEPTMHPRDVKVKSITKTTKTGESRHKPYIEIEIVSTEPFYVGAQEWGLTIGDVCKRWRSGGSFDTRSLLYIVTMQEWHNLPEGAPMYIVYGGCLDASDRKLAKPFAYLNKKMLRQGLIVAPRSPRLWHYIVRPPNKSLDASRDSVFCMKLL